ncbi:MAG: hypothetical protein H7308_10420 [Chthonomonadaceae bacterium]|nr:hypothetical protein [Chthonomonadaceae bacterium]
MTRYDLGMSEQELDKTQSMFPLSPSEKTQLWTPAYLPKPNKINQARTHAMRQRVAVSLLLLLFALSIGFARWHSLSSTPHKAKKTATKPDFSRVIAPVFSPVPSPPPVSYPEASRWKPTDKTIVQPHAPIPDE